MASAPPFWVFGDVVFFLGVKNYERNAFSILGHGHRPLRWTSASPSPRRGSPAFSAMIPDRSAGAAPLTRFVRRAKERGWGGWTSRLFRAWSDVPTVGYRPIHEVGTSRLPATAPSAPPLLPRPRRGRAGRIEIPGTGRRGRRRRPIRGQSDEARLAGSAPPWEDGGGALFLYSDTGATAPPTRIDERGRRRRPERRPPPLLPSLGRGGARLPRLPRTRARQAIF